MVLLLILCWALAAGALTLAEEQALLAHVGVVVGREEEAEPPDHAFCGTPLLVEARAALGAEGRRQLAKLLQRPALPWEHRSPSGHFRIHYELSGRNRVDSADGDGNQVPDYVDTVAAALDRAWELQVGQLGYQAPPGDGGLGGGDEYDVYLVQLGSGGAYGYTYPEQGGNRSSSYLELDNDYTDAIYVQTRGLDALHATVAHEFFHAIQFGYYQGSDGVWWQEASSTWMEEVAYPEVNDYLQYLNGFLGQPGKSLNSGSSFSADYRIYGACLFAHFLDLRHGRDLIRAIWEELGSRSSAGLEHFDRAIRQRAPGGFGGVMGEFAVWNYLTGKNYRLPSRYPDGERYPQVGDTHLNTLAKVAVADNGQVDHLGSAYVVLEPRLQPGGVLVEVQTPRGRWSQQVLLIGRDTVEVRALAGGQLRLAGWDRYDSLVVVLAQNDQVGNSYEYTVSAEYDPELIDEPVPQRSALKQNYPNPFRPGQQRHTAITFGLSQPSTRTALSIFTAEGQLVWRRYLGVRSARTYTEFWDGTNEAGEPVGSGIYYYVLEGEDFSASRALAVVRGD
ncbi:MAG: hypothetical protein FJY95_17320 [Candidatus Handelsmanbacteria bacterium]|nr:hypothetical protein [Candidatus Handelsmanbacteria bacterium]